MPRLPTNPGRPLWQSPEDRLGLSVEILVVVLIGVAPYLVLALIERPSESEHSAAAASSGFAAVFRLALIVQIVAPTLLFMWRSRRGWPYFGMVRPSLSVDLVLAVGYVLIAWLSYIVFWVAGAALARIVPGLHEIVWSSGSSEASAQVRAEIHATPGPLLITMVLANGFAEELVTKSYLIPRLREFSGSTVVAVVGSAAMFASYHIYQGPYAALSIGFSQLVLGWLFTRWGRLWPFAIGHGLYDLILFSMR